MSIHAVILAAGKGTRMRSRSPKVLQRIGGRPMLGHVLDTAATAGVSVCHVVLGHEAERVREWLATAAPNAQSVDAVVQEPQLGTAHAVQQALPEIPDEALVVVLYGDVPLVPAATIRALAAATGDGLAIVTARPADPTGYGRILRDDAGLVLGVVEEREASTAQRALGEVNTGLLAAPARRLRGWLQRVRNDNAKGEFYLTDVVALAVADGVTVTTFEAADAELMEGVNDARQLASAERRCQLQQARALMAKGVRLADPARFDLRGSLQCGQDVEIDVGCVFEGHVELGDGVSIGPYCVLRDVHVAAGARIRSHSVLEQAELGAGCQVGPFSRLRPGARLEAEVHVGNFVEIKNSHLGVGTKAGHLAYVGDADVGARVNVSAGVITCNYDGANKHRTRVGDDAFIGTDTQLVAPVEVGAGAFVAAGSTIARNVPAGGLSICRAREQKHFPDWKRPVKTRK
ncbi:MAG TPA: bifunctional UDP-N-acetylglucosamine diphosphorylase/glucosamine-1-phosphate N-acetyltransferase GlmU [Nevskiaceae bacterium]|nr:bifunctional UDP-N-acetylglucosamine diphosphorylase/glucosamine-1-phosphate N-acetyltransferase GlmU [Nevskiaceae bacterium]